VSSTFLTETTRTHGSRSWFTICTEPSSASLREDIIVGAEVAMMDKALGFG
jgi:hypothetical protein